ncbi:MAG: PQQ-binding-like beta-propeller repeat protein [Candidatus Velthaea sp.]|jgi:outer membrane protein assembly factor BamB
MRRSVLLAVFVSLLGIAKPADWPLFGHDAMRSAVSADGALTSANVARLALRWHIVLGSVADSAPIVVGDRLFQTSRDGTTYGIDAASGQIVWRFETHGPNITTSVPAYDPATRVLYVPGVDGNIHKLDPADGHEQRGNGFPAAITLARDTEKNASPLNLANGFLYAQTSGYIGDATPYIGHVVAIRLRDGVTTVFNSLCSSRRALIEPGSCDAQRAGMWSRAGVVVDSDPAMQGRIYAATGNGPYDARAGNYGDSILSLAADASRLLGALTPDDYARLEAQDLDVGSSSPALLPRQPDSATPLLAVQGGKDGVLRLFDRAHLNGRPPLQTVPLDNELFSAPAVWTGPHAATFVFLGLADGVHAFRLTTVNGTSRLTPVWRASLAGAVQGTSPAVAGGMVFIATSGQLVALDAQTGDRLWSGPLGQIHWESPAIAGGAVYCSDENGGLSAFALTGRGGPA